MTASWTKHGLTCGLALACLLAGTSAASARTRLESICTVYGQHEVKLTGLGLVVGLNGTGDGARSLPTIRALAAALKLMNNPVADLKDLGGAKNVAIVMVSATIPKTGARRGQKIDCRVSSFMGAKDLRGGQLLATPLETVDIRDDVVVALASGDLSVENTEVPTSGVVVNGAQVERNFSMPFVRDGKVTLLLNRSHAGFHTASEVARVVNAEFSFEAGNRRIAHPVRPGVIEVAVPDHHRESPIDFVAQVLDVGIDNPHTQARVVVNSRTGTVVVTGEVEISPVVVAHANLTVTIGAPAAAPAEPVAGPGFVPLSNEPGSQAPQRLQDLVKALNALKVPTGDVIEIIRVLNRSGKLHAEYIEE